MEISIKDAQNLSKWLNSSSKRELSDYIRYLCRESTQEERSTLSLLANELREKYYDTKVYFRALIEFSSYCKNDCLYCGLRRSNFKAKRYRLSLKEIIECCKEGYEMGFRTFVLQSGEDGYYSDAYLCRIVSNIKERYPNCAVTLSIGERSHDSYKKLFESGTDRYLLRHETADEDHYGKLHPPELTFKNRKRCLYDLKEIGYQIGAGFMVGSPFQTFDTLAEDFIFLRELSPHMIGIGPFIPHGDTSFSGFYKPTAYRTLIMLSLIRIMLPKTLLPATTALGTIDDMGRERGLMAGANVLMPNLSPAKHRLDYSIYDNKLCTGLESGEHLAELAHHIKSIGFVPEFSRGDHVDFQRDKF